MPSTPSRRKAVLLLVITALLWSTNGVLVKVLDWKPRHNSEVFEISELYSYTSTTSSLNAMEKTKPFSKPGGFSFVLHNQCSIAV